MTLQFSTRQAHECAAPVTNAVEGFSPKDGHLCGSLDRVAYVCPDHIDTARAEYMTGLAPFTVLMRDPAPGDVDTPCGKVTDFYDEPAEVRL